MSALKGPENPADEELMRRYASGDASAFEELYRRYSGQVYAYLLKKLLRRHDADELHQAVFLKFHRSRHQYDPKFPVLQWLYVISKTAVMDFYRKEKRSVPTAEYDLENHPEYPAQVSQAPTHPALDSLERLSDEQRRVVEWRHLDSLSFEEIAAKLGKSQVSVRQILSRAMRKLRNALAHSPKGSDG